VDGADVEAVHEGVSIRLLRLVAHVAEGYVFGCGGHAPTVPPWCDIGKSYLLLSGKVDPPSRRRYADAMTPTERLRRVKQAHRRYLQAATSLGQARSEFVDELEDAVGDEEAGLSYNSVAAALEKTRQALQDMRDQEFARRAARGSDREVPCVDAATG
jgi:hypothetical protein